MEMHVEKLAVLEEGNEALVGPMMACCVFTYSFMI